MNEHIKNIDIQELDKFGSHTQDWWDPDGSLKTLHHINPVRLGYIDKTVSLTGKSVLDLGCGGGLLAEAMAQKGAQVTGLDANEAVLAVARAHRQQSDLDIEYITGTAENHALNNNAVFDVITCMELLEHVPDVSSLIASCATLLKPGGHLILATINRTLKAYTSAILGAEYLLGLLPRGTHDYGRFIRPSEMGTALRQHGFRVMDIAGMAYIPGLNTCAITGNPSVNYLVHAVLPKD